MMSLTFGLFTQVSGSGPLGLLVLKFILLMGRSLSGKLVCPRTRNYSYSILQLGRAGVLPPVLALATVLTKCESITFKFLI